MDVSHTVTFQFQNKKTSKVKKSICKHLQTPIHEHTVFSYNVSQYRYWIPSKSVKCYWTPNTALCHWGTVLCFAHFFLLLHFYCVALWDMVFNTTPTGPVTWLSPLAIFQWTAYYMSIYIISKYGSGILSRLGFKPTVSWDKVLDLGVMMGVTLTYLQFVVFYNWFASALM